MKQRIGNFLLFILLIAFDQLTKLWAKTIIKDEGPFQLIPKVLKLQYHENNGAVWGILSGKQSFLIILTIVLMLLLIYFYMKIPADKRLTPIRIIWVFIMAGAIGNFIDRISLGYVVDFIYIELIDFPIFNFADMYLTLSCALLVVLVLFYYKDKDLAFIDDLFRRKKTQLTKASEDNAGSEAGNDTGDEAGSEAGNNTGDEAGSEAGNDTVDDVGSEAGNGTGAGSETGK